MSNKTRRQLKQELMLQKENQTIASNALNALTLVSSKAINAISAASEQTKANAATALGITADQLDALFAGKYLRVDLSGTKVAVASVSSSAVILSTGDFTNATLGSIKVTLAASKYAIAIIKAS